MSNYKTDKELTQIFGFEPLSTSWKYHSENLGNSKIPDKYIKKIYNLKFGGEELNIKAAKIAVHLMELKNAGIEATGSKIPDEIVDYAQEQSLGNQYKIHDILPWELAELNEDFFYDLADSIKAFKDVSNRRNNVTSLLNESPRNMDDFINLALHQLIEEWYDTTDKRWKDETGRGLYLLTRDDIIIRADEIAFKFKPEKTEYEESAYRKAFQAIGMEYIHTNLRNQNYMGH